MGILGFVVRWGKTGNLNFALVLDLKYIQTKTQN